MRILNTGEKSMKQCVLIVMGAFALSSCAQTPEEAAAYRQFGMQMLSAQAQANAQAMSEPMPTIQPPVRTRCYQIGNTINCTSQ
jgi:starvation-inducible outer membrane lipoprotein